MPNDDDLDSRMHEMGKRQRLRGKPFPLYQTDGNSTKSMGFAMSQNRLAVPTWSYAMEIAPPRTIIEIGHAGGGFTTAIALHARTISARFRSYDLCDVDERYEQIAKALGVVFRKGDVWAHEEEIAFSIQCPGTTFVLCDGGDKRRELATFAKYLKPGDVIAAHDYDAAHEIDPGIPSLERPWPWSEIRPGDVAEVVERCGLEPWLQASFDLAGWLVYRKRA